MCRTPQILRALPFLLLLTIVACSQTPRMSEDRETEYIRMLREEFFKTHPDGQFNEHIARGEVVRGMDFLEVLASWGNPSKREKPTVSVEYWMYRDDDEDSGDWVQYKFIFRKNVLEDWELTRHVADGRQQPMASESSSSVLTKTRTGVGTESAPKKK